MSSTGIKFDQKLATLIQQLKLSVAKILKSIVVESWTNRLYRMSQNDGNYLR